MVNFNVYLNMEKSRSRGRRGRGSRSIRRASTARARVPNELQLHAATIAQNLEHNLPLAINTLVRRAIKATLQADQGEDREVQDQEHPRPEKEEDLPLHGTLQDLHGTIAQSLQHGLPSLIRGAVMSALLPNQGQDRRMQDQETTQEEKPTPEDRPEA